MSKEDVEPLRERSPTQADQHRIRASQLVLIKMLETFHNLSSTHNFKYWIEAGTLLGAVRHQGFVPWDCDIDIGILRKDFERFEREAVLELPDEIFFQAPGTNPAYYGNDVAKLIDKSTSLQIELFVYDKIYPPIIANLHNSLTYLIKKIIKHSEYVAYWRFYAFSSDKIFPLKFMEFEGNMLPCLNDYHGYLRFHYGEYMKLPPVEHRVPPNPCIPKPFEIPELE